MRILQENPDLIQRELTENLDICVGGLICCLKGLMEKVLVKMNNFANSKGKFGYADLLPPSDVLEKTTSTHRFLQHKMVECEALKAKIEALKNEWGTNQQILMQKDKARVCAALLRQQRKKHYSDFNLGALKTRILGLRLSRPRSHR